MRKIRCASRLGCPNPGEWSVMVLGDLQDGERGPMCARCLIELLLPMVPNDYPIILRRLRGEMTQEQMEEVNEAVLLQVKEVAASRRRQRKATQEGR